MEYVESFDLLGVAARQKPCLTGSGAPTVPAVSGELYLDTGTGNLYKYVSGGWQLHKTGTDIPFFDLEALGLVGDREANPSVQEISVDPALMAQLTEAMDAGPISVKIGFYSIDREYGTATVLGYGWHVLESNDYGMPIQLGYYGSRPVTVIIVFHPDRNTITGDAWLLTDEARLEEALAQVKASDAFFPVTLDTQTMKASHTAPQILAADAAGKVVVGVANGLAMQFISRIVGAADTAVFVQLAMNASTNTLDNAYVTVDHSGNVQMGQDFAALVPVPASSDAGKVLMAANGAAVWQTLIPTLDLVGLGVPDYIMGAGQAVSKTITASQLSNAVAALNGSGLVKIHVKGDAGGQIIESTIVCGVMKYADTGGKDVYQMCVVLAGIGSVMVEVYTASRRIDVVSYMLV